MKISWQERRIPDRAKRITIKDISFAREDHGAARGPKDL